MDAQINDPLVVAEGIEKYFPGVKALDGVDFSVYRGQLNAIIGENGAGKSTLTGVLAGVHRPDSGQIFLDGQEVTFSSPREAQTSGIVIIYQELNLIPDLSVTENIFLGREYRTPLGFADYRRMSNHAAKLLSQLQLPIDPRVPVGSLRVGQQQLVEIAKALSFDARIIIMDEPTSALSEHEIEVLFGLIETLKARGIAIVYVTHKLEELFRIGDRVTVLRDGKLVGSGLIGELDHANIVQMMVGRDLKLFYKRTHHETKGEVLRVEKASLQHSEGKDDDLIQNIHLSVKRGEVLGIFGLMGAGRTTLLEAIFGLHPRTFSGTTIIDGKSVTIRSPHDAIAAGIGMAPEDRNLQGLIPWMSVAANISLSILHRIQRFSILSTAKEKDLVEVYVHSLNIKMASLNQAVQNLSGGNQQKVILARWLLTQPKVLLLDEPTRGIDVGAKSEIYGLIDNLTHHGLAIVLVSSELPEIMALADRIMVMSEGCKTAEFVRGEASDEDILKAALPRSA